MRIPKVSNMYSPSSGREVANQYEIDTGNKVYFQSYHTIIAVRDFTKYPMTITLDKNSWDYSVTTSKYRNQFLGEDTKETRRKIKDGTYKLKDLNK